MEGGEEMRGWLLEKLKPFSVEIEKIWEEREKELGEVWLRIAQQLTFQAFDLLWLEHIDTMTELRGGIGLRGYGGRDPLVEYKKEARLLFDRLINEIWGAAADRLERVEIKRREGIPLAQRERQLVLQHPTAALGQEQPRPPSLPPEADAGGETRMVGTVARKGKKIGRNDPCPCGSGKKYKKCCYPKYS